MIIIGITLQNTKTNALEYRMQKFCLIQINMKRIYLHS